MLSPCLLGQQEPWDAAGFHYSGLLLAGGLVSGLLAPRPVWAHYAGCVCGQLTYQFLFTQIGPLFLVEFAFLLVYSLIFLLAAFAGAHIRLRFNARASVR